MRKWFLPALLVIVCAYAAIQMWYSLNEREKPAEPAPGASPSATASPASPSPSPSAVPGEGSSPAATVDEAAATAIYKTNCLSCHGDQLQGQFGPKLSNVGSSMNLAQITKQIENGSGGMPSFKGTLTDDQIKTVANWLAAKK